MSRRIKCSLSAYPDAWVELPDEWLGEHLHKRDMASRAASKYANGQITIAAISMALADDWGGIAGLEGRDPSKWDFLKVPIPLLAWLEVTVFNSFSEAFTVPKVSSPPLMSGLTRLLATIKQKIMAGY